jgi:hypothetical protein
MSSHRQYITMWAAVNKKHTHVAIVRNCMGGRLDIISGHNIATLWTSKHNVLAKIAVGIRRWWLLLRKMSPVQSLRL